jgi:hypothetical protein
MSAITTGRFKFSTKDAKTIEAAFEKGIMELNKSLATRSGLRADANNHFDEKFHEALLRGEHLKQPA